jgi:prepilin-type N-terminal cleavage/methylation domain-containing protein
MTFTKKRSGFTLIELLVVIAILATIAGGILVSYDGLETDAAQAQATFNISGTDRAVRTYRTLNKAFPDKLDSLLFSPARASMRPPPR